MQQPPFQFPGGIQITIPTGYSYFPREPFAFPERESRVEIAPMTNVDDVIG